VGTCALEGAVRLVHGFAQLRRHVLVVVRFVPGPVGVTMMGGEIVHRHLGLVRRRRGPEMEVPVRDDLRTRLLGEAHGTAEVVGMGVGDDDGVDVLHREARLAQPVLDGLPGARPGEARIDDRGAFGVEQRVAVHVAEPGQVDGELHSQHIRGDFGDLLRCRFLLLSLRHGPQASSRGRSAPDPPR
jgi:hypothetical protein